LIEYNKKNIGLPIFNIKDRLGLTSLHYSVIFNNFETLKILIDEEANPLVISNDGLHVYQIALQYKRTNLLKYLLDKTTNFNFLSKNGETILQSSITYQNFDIIEYLLDKNVININNQETEYGLSALFQAIILGNTSLINKMIKLGANINLTDFMGNTPLHYVLIEKHIKILEILMEHENINFNISNLNGDYPLHIIMDLVLSGQVSN
jgi:ankyrin repeat protein